MTQVLGDVLRRTGVLGLAFAVAVALAVYELVGAVVAALPMTLIAKAGADGTVRIRETEFQYNSVLATLLSLVIVAGLLVLVWRLGNRETRSCPDCLSEIPFGATVCRYCTGEVGPRG